MCQDLPHLLKEMDDYYELYGNRRNLFKLRRALIGICCLIFLFALSSNSIRVRNDNLNNSTFERSLMLTNLRLVESLIRIYSIVPICFLVILYCVTYYMLQANANDLVKDLHSKAINTLQSSPSLIEELRRQHHSLCKLIVRSNSVVGHFIAVTYGGGIPCLLFMLHGFVYGNLKMDEFKQMALVFFYVTIVLIFVTFSGIALNRKMHKPAEYLLGLNIAKMPGKGSEIVAAFLSRLQGKSIGFNVYHLFTIDTSIILMVCGTILTYAVVIIQFQPGVRGGGGNVMSSAHSNLLHVNGTSNTSVLVNRTN